MSPKKGQSSAGKMPRSQSRGSGPVPLVPNESILAYEVGYLDDEDDLSFNTTQFVLQTTNDHIRNRIAKLQANTVRLKRELWLLQRHVKEFNHPLFENWEADMLTRLIEVAHAYQRQKMAGGVAIGEATTAERETLSRAYGLAAKQIRESTLHKLGLSERYHEALLRYPEVAAYRSPNPFQTEVAFAKWLIEEKENKPEMYGFWAKLFPVCYGRTVEESCSIF